MGLCAARPIVRIHGRERFAAEHGGVAATLLGCSIHSTLDAGVHYPTSDLRVRYARTRSC